MRAQGETFTGRLATSTKPRYWKLYTLPKTYIEVAEEDVLRIERCPNDTTIVVRPAVHVTFNYIEA